MKRKIMIFAVGLIWVIGLGISWGGEVRAPHSVKPGDIFLVEASPDGQHTKVSGEFNGATLYFTKFGGKFGALAAVDVADRSISKNLRVVFSGQDGVSRLEKILRLKVLPRNFPVVKVKRTPYTKNELKVIAADKRRLNEALAKSSVTPLWDESFAYPVSNTTVSKGGEFGLIRKSKIGRSFHTGIDFYGSRGEDVRASNKGRVVFSGKTFLEGNLVIIDHGLKLFSMYMHLESIAVKVGDVVERGSVVGALGSSGRSTGPHLHFAIRFWGAHVDPVKLINLFGDFGIKRAAIQTSWLGDDLTLLDLVYKAQELLKGEEVSLITKDITVYSGLDNSKKKTRKKTMVVGKEILLVTLTSQNMMRLVRLDVPLPKNQPKGKFIITQVMPSECLAEKIGGGGVNSNFRITCNGEEEIVLASLHLVFDDKKMISPQEIKKKAEHIIYTPYSDNFILPEIVEEGRFYIESQITAAREELEHAKIRSRAITGKLVSEVISEKTLFRISLIEHIDHDEFKKNGPLYMGNKVLIQFALNRKATFLYARSKKGALCLMQVMPSTYSGIRRSYPEAKLPIKASEGVCADHKDAIKAAYLVLDSKLSFMPVSFKEKYLADPDTYGIFLAVAYNGGEKRAAKLYEKMQPSFLSKILSDLFSIFSPKKSEFKTLKWETWVFIKKYMEIAEQFSD